VRSTDYSFGSTAAIVTSTALIAGLGAASASRATVVSGLLVVALADNLTDSISIHLYQEAEDLDRQRAFRSTLVNFAARLVVALTFVALVVLLPSAAARAAAMAWGMSLLVVLTVLLSRERGLRLAPEIAKHIAAAAATVAASHLIGSLIQEQVR